MQLVLNTPGSSLLRHQDMFRVVHADGEQLLSPLKLRSICMGKGAHLSSDAILLALEHEIEILFTDRGGFPKGRVWSSRFGSISTIRRRQVSFAQGQEGLAWVREVIGRKLHNQTALLLSMATPGSPTEKLVEEATDRIERHLASIRAAEGYSTADLASSLRGWEGSASQAYFSCLSECLPEPYRFSGRSRQPARDMFNCLLNYAYGMLYGQVEGALIKAGLDPYLGVMHRDDYNRPVLVYDLIEQYRVWADYVVTDLCLQQVVFREMFDVGDDGGYWLNALGRRVLIQGMNDYLSEVIALNGLSRSRSTHLELDAQALAQRVLHHLSPPEEGGE